VEALLGDAIQRRKLVEAGIVNQNVQTSAGSLCFIEKAVNVFSFPDVRL
jgi:hypothetical protein